MDRRTFIGTVAVSLLAAPITAVAQQAGKVPRIGMLLPGAAPPGQPSPLLDAFRAALRDLGYVEGQNVVIEDRWSEGRDEGFSDLAADLVRLNVAVIVTQGTSAVRAAKAATSSIPIVMAFVSDPVAIGVVASAGSRSCRCLHGRDRTGAGRSGERHFAAHVDDHDFHGRRGRLRRQYLFATDVLGTNRAHTPRHAKTYRNFAAEFDRLQGERVGAFTQYAADIASGAFPEARHIVAIPPAELQQFLDFLGKH